MKTGITDTSKLHKMTGSKMLNEKLSYIFYIRRKSKVYMYCK